MDVSFCEGKDCPIRESCFRWLWHTQAVKAKRVCLRQSYIFEQYDPDSNRCPNQLEESA